MLLELHAKKVLGLGMITAMIDPKNVKGDGGSNEKGTRKRRGKEGPVDIPFGISILFSIEPGV